MPRKLLILGWDSADWKLLSPLVDSGRMPALARLIEAGCMGQISTLHPVYSPMLWTSIATGKRPDKHGVLGFVEPLPDRSGIRPVSSLSRRTKAFWNIFHQQGWRGHVVGWWPSHPAEPINGCMISNLCHQAFGPDIEEWALPPGGVHPPEWRDELAALRVHPNDFSPAEVAPFIPRAREIDQDKDPRLAMFLKTLAEACTVHSWALHLIEHTSWDYVAVYYDALDHFSHGFMKYHPPRRDFIRERDFELYSGVMTQVACFHDMMLGALLSKLPADTTVMLLSDHGFHPDEARPSSLAPIPAGPAEEHSDFGIFVLSGPGIKADHLLHGTSILDVTPTLLALQDLPVGADMDGRTVLDAFATPPVVRLIPSWDNVLGDAGSHAAALRIDPRSEQAALEQLIALGYLQRPSADVAQAVRRTQDELDFNLAEALIDGRKELEALPILRELCARSADEWRFHFRLAMACKSVGRVAELRDVVDRLQARRPECEAARDQLNEWQAEIRRRIERDRAQPAAALPAAAWLTPEEQQAYARASRLAALNTHGLAFLRAVVALAEDRAADAILLLRDAEKGMARRPGLYLQIGETYQRLGRWVDAEDAFRRALQLDPRNPHAHVGLARSLLARRRWPDAAEAARTAIAALHTYPLAHFLLGVALQHQGATDDAAAAWSETLRQNPSFWPAHLRLARLLKLSAPEQSAWHRDQARTARERAVAIASGELSQAGAGRQSAAHVGTSPLAAFPPEVLGTPQPPFGSRAVTLVTGLPRSGTSLVMQLLAAGGLEPLTDGRRVADADNPRGYFELEMVKSLPADNACIESAAGKAVKVVLPLLHHVPARLHYHVLLVERDLDEILASQQTMLARNGHAANDPGSVRVAYEGLLRRSRLFLDGLPFARTLRLNHRWIIDHPDAAAQAIADFLAGGLDTDRMAAAVDPSLHRHRGVSASRLPFP